MIEYTYNKQYLIKDKKPWFPVMGEMHYSRYPKEYWKESIYKMKAGGVEIVSTYVIWIHHEEIEGEYDFSGNRDLHGFLQVCKECNEAVQIEEEFQTEIIWEDSHKLREEED